MKVSKLKTKEPAQNTQIIATRWYMRTQNTKHVFVLMNNNQVFVTPNNREL